jgi:hypothetical protein
MNDKAVNFFEKRNNRNDKILRLISFQPSFSGLTLRFIPFLRSSFAINSKLTNTTQLRIPLALYKKTKSKFASH